MIHSNFSLGFSTNLVKGLDPSWQPQAGLLNILHPAEQQAMALRPVEPAAQRGTWSHPVISLHETALSLLDDSFRTRLLVPPAI